MSVCRGCEERDRAESVVPGDSFDGPACERCGRTYDVKVAADGVPRATRRLEPGQDLVLTRATYEAIRRNKRPEKLS